MNATDPFITYKKVLSSRGRELPPPPLTEPYVKLSLHTALIIQPKVKESDQKRGWWVYYYENGGKPEIYCGSADLMERNLSRRVEILFPVIDQEILDHLKQNLDLMLSDNTLAFNLQQDGSYRRISKKAQDPEINSQMKLLEWYAEENPFGSV